LAGACVCCVKFGNHDWLLANWQALAFEWKPGLIRALRDTMCPARHQTLYTHSLARSFIHQLFMSRRTHLRLTRFSYIIPLRRLLEKYTERNSQYTCSPYNYDCQGRLSSASLPLRLNPPIPPFPSSFLPSLYPFPPFPAPFSLSLPFPPNPARKSGERRKLQPKIEFGIWMIWRVYFSDVHEELYIDFPPSLAKHFP